MRNVVYWFGCLLGLIVLVYWMMKKIRKGASFLRNVLRLIHRILRRRKRLSSSFFCLGVRLW